MLRNVIFCGATALLALLPSAAADKPPAVPSASCFLARDWVASKATPDARALYIRVENKGIYRLDFAAACQAAQWPGAQFRTRLHADWICTPADIDLKVATSPGAPPVPCVVDKITPLTPDEAKALPKELQP